MLLANFAFSQIHQRLSNSPIFGIAPNKNAKLIGIDKLKCLVMIIGIKK